MRRRRKHIVISELDWFGRAFVLSVLFAGGFIAGSLLASIVILAYRGLIA